MKKRALILSLSVFSFGLSFSQTAIKVKLADQLYCKFAYTDAIPYYENLSSRESGNPLYLSRLADCYRLTGNTQKAELAYARLTAMENAAPANYYYYAQMLDENKKYADAQKYYKLYNEKNSADSRSGRKTAFNVQELFKDSAFYKIKNCEFNSSNSDFALFPFFESSYMFASNRPSEVSVKHTYVWNNQPFLDMYTVKKNEDGSFSFPSPVPGEVNSVYHEGPIFFDKNSNTFYITRNNFNDKKFRKSKDGINKLKLYIVNLDGTANKSFDEFEFNSDEYSVGHAAVSPDGQRLYFSSDMPGGFGLADIYVCVKENNKWGKPQNLGSSINTEGNEMFPFVSEGNKLYFSSEGHAGLGGLDVYSADISGNNFTAVKNIGYPINSSKDDFSFFIAADNKSGYFSSNREEGRGDDDIYSFAVLKKHFFVSGKAIDKTNGSILAGVKISLSDESGTQKEEVMTGDDGSYKFEIEPEKEYKLKGEKEKYYEGLNPFSSKNLGSETEIKADVPLEKDPGLSLYGLITDKASKLPLSDVKVVVIDNFTNAEIVNLKTPANGDFRKPLADKKISDRLSYQIKLEKEGYLGKTLTFNAEITKAGEIKLHEALDISLDKIEVGTDIGKLINISPIYFDLSKWNIRKDASVELDKIVKVMNENPSMEIELGSHTDCRGTAASNLTLSDKRAKSSAEYIRKNISNPSRIYGKGYGESSPVNECKCEGNIKSSCPETEHQNNRRTEFKILKF